MVTHGVMCSSRVSLVSYRNTAGARVTMRQCHSSCSRLSRFEPISKRVAIRYAPSDMPQTTVSCRQTCTRIARFGDTLRASVARMRAEDRPPAPSPRPSRVPLSSSPNAELRARPYAPSNASVEIECNGFVHDFITTNRCHTVCVYVVFLYSRSFSCFI